MKKSFLLMILVLVGVLFSCGGKKEVKIGVSFGAGPAVRWRKEKEYMEAYAREHEIDIEVILNTSGSNDAQFEDCKRLIDSGIDVLVLMPNDATKMSTIVDYAQEKKVKIVNYARIIFDSRIDLFVGYDSKRIGKILGEFLIEKVPKGKYVILSGDANDNNATLLYEGAMLEIESIKNDIQIVADENIEKWSVDTAKELIEKILLDNNKEVDAILAPNDKIAGAVTEIIQKLGITRPIVVTGMDAELDAIKRIIKDEQAMSIYLDLKKLADKAIEQAEIIAQGKKAEINASLEFEALSIPSNLINGTLIIKQNIDRVLIDSGFYTREEVYGNN